MCVRLMQKECSGWLWAHQCWGVVHALNLVFLAYTY